MGSKIVKKIRAGRAEKTFFIGVIDSTIPREFVSKTTGGVARDVLMMSVRCQGGQFPMRRESTTLARRVGEGGRGGERQHPDLRYPDLTFV